MGGRADEVGRLGSLEEPADADARMRVFVIGGLILGALIFLLHAAFSVVGLRLGWWAVPVFVPLLVWLLVSAACNRVLRPVELDDLGVRQRLGGAAGLLFVLWVVWPLWAGPAAGAWRHAHGGFGVASGGAKFPLSAVLGASPLVMGVVAFLWVAIGMVLAPRIPAREPRRIGAPGDPEPVRAPFSGPRRRSDRTLNLFPDTPGLQEQCDWPKYAQVGRERLCRSVQ